MLKQTHKARQTNAKIAQQLQERLDENRRVSGQLVQLSTSVKAREAIHRSKMDASGGEINPAQQVSSNFFITVILNEQKNITNRDYCES